MALPTTLNSFLETWSTSRRLRRVLRVLQEGGLQVLVVYDIGANKGRWARDTKRLLPAASFFLFEANESHRKKLASRGFPFFICVLGSREEHRRFYSTGGTGDSLYLEKTHHYGETDYREVTTIPLQILVEKERLPRPNFMKLDVQGAELEILSGCQGLLDRCYLIYMECPILEYNSGAPTFDSYIRFMSDRGYVPIQILQQHVIEGALTQVDILFLMQDCIDTSLLS